MSDTYTQVDENNDAQSLVKIWQVIVEIHNEAKGLFLLAEEMEPNEFRSFIQPFNELRHAYEHAIRAKINQIGLDKKPKDFKYQYNCLKRTLGHEYRAFFDCADWLSVILREDILKTLNPYNVSSINTALPDYYKEMRPRIDEITTSIAKIRGDKDISKKRESEDDGISKDVDVIDEIRAYKIILEELKSYVDRIHKIISSLEECESKLKRQSRKHWRWGIIGGIIGSVVGGLILAGAIYCCGKIGTISSKSEVQQNTHITTQSNTDKPSP